MNTTISLSAFFFKNERKTLIPAKYAQRHNVNKFELLFNTTNKLELINLCKLIKIVVSKFQFQELHNFFFPLMLSVCLSVSLSLSLSRCVLYLCLVEIVFHVHLPLVFCKRNRVNKGLID